MSEKRKTDPLLLTLQGSGHPTDTSQLVPDSGANKVTVMTDVEPEKLTNVDEDPETRPPVSKILVPS